MWTYVRTYVDRAHMCVCMCVVYVIGLHYTYDHIAARSPTQEQVRVRLSQQTQWCLKQNLKKNLYANRCCGIVTHAIRTILVHAPQIQHKRKNRLWICQGMSLVRQTRDKDLCRVQSTGTPHTGQNSVMFGIAFCARRMVRVPVVWAKRHFLVRITFSHFP